MLITQLRQRAIEAGGQPDHAELMLASDEVTMLTMLTMLGHLEAVHGGIGAYFSAISLGTNEIRRLADRLCGRAC